MTATNSQMGQGKKCLYREKDKANDQINTFGWFNKTNKDN